jgi:hypothetical protein
MADTYTISSGSGRVELDGVITRNLNLGELGTLSVQVVSDGALNAPITLKLQQSIDGTNWHDLPETPLVTDSGANSNLLQTASFYTNLLAVYIDVGSATLGTLTIYNTDND